MNRKSMTREATLIRPQSSRLERRCALHNIMEGVDQEKLLILNFDHDLNFDEAANANLNTNNNISNAFMLKPKRNQKDNLGVLVNELENELDDAIRDSDFDYRARTKRSSSLTSNVLVNSPSLRNKPHVYPANSSSNGFSLSKAKTFILSPDANADAINSMAFRNKNRKAK